MKFKTIRRDSPETGLSTFDARRSTGMKSCWKSSLRLAVVAATATWALAGCGGGLDASGEPAVARGIAPLLDHEGGVMPSDPQAVPADPAARTRRQQYATVAQAEMLMHALPGDVIALQVDCCGDDATHLAVLTAYGLQAAQDLTDSAPVLVHGSDLRQAAIVADRLAEKGMTRVFLVTR
jgi:hypothetical protein